VAAAVGLGRPDSLEAEALSLADAATILLDALMRDSSGTLPDLARMLSRSGWAWAPSVCAAVGVAEGDTQVRRAPPLAIWTRLPEWEDAAPRPPASHFPVDPAEARQRLAAILWVRDAGELPEARPQQADYASALTQAFAPRTTLDAPSLVIAEAGTGVGKTLGYLAPATVWAERNGGAVWISTFTRNLQNQIDSELHRLYPDEEVKRQRVVLRKGRENYLCLLNYEEAVRGAATRPRDLLPLALMARWAAATADGAFNGGDFPGWLTELIGRPLSVGLADRRGECIYSACPHYTRCFIEHSVRRARYADIVIANHALVMVQAALGGLDDASLPSRYVFDEGHHLFDAADSAFAAHLSGAHTAELRRWILGTEGGPGRARGLKRRLEDLLADADSALEDLQAIAVAAASLAGDGWGQRLADEAPRGPVERFLALVHHQILARAPDLETPYDIETDRHPLLDGLVEQARSAGKALSAIEQPAKRLSSFLRGRLDDDAEELDSAFRVRIEAMIRSLERRVVNPIQAWREMLADLDRPTPDGMVDWFAITRNDGRDVDVGLHRHWIDPTLPFAESVLASAHGAAITSATLTDGPSNEEASWLAAEQRTGALHLAGAPIRAAVPSPFDYSRQTRALVVTDVRKDDLDLVAAAYRELFLAAGGGALGLFTAISRLRAVRERILAPLDEAGLILHAQHVDGLDVGTLVDMFRAEEDACLLGTDAVRDGVDVPGRSLRLIVFDRVPWPRPSILHRARRQAFGGGTYDDMLTRLRLRQAFGRLVRRADDAGVFVLLDPMMPSRLATFLPDGVTLERVGLAEAVATTRTFLATRHD
jgi:ATP-dependent DNA helicase DinG